MNSLSKVIFSTWATTGRVLYRLTWPALYLYLNNTSRSRVVVAFEDEILVLKDWLGDSSWKLPGGGVHRGEDPKTSAVRELKEETGITATEAELTNQHEIISTSRNLKVVLHCYQLRLKSKPKVKPQKLEILTIDWISRIQLLGSENISENTREILSLE